MENREISNLTVVGGGTAGWLAALYAQKTLPDVNVIVVESEKIGILGAGEGTTIHLPGLLEFLEIPISSIISETDATLKNGIKFTNWNGEGPTDFYYHGFDFFRELSASEISMPFYHSNTAVYYPYAHSNNSVEKLDFCKKLSEENKVPFSKVENPLIIANDAMYAAEQHGFYGLHIDAYKLAAFLKEVALFRGVKRVVGEVISIELDGYEEISSLGLASEESVSTDFVIDASGFARIFQKEFNLEWVSAADYLPVDSALPFFLEMPEDKDIPPYTEALAATTGWFLKIPLQTRFGCGYVYESSKISEEEVKEEIASIFGDNVTFPRETPFKFSSGYYSTPFYKNFVSVGLASGFFEHLEATSIWTTILSLRSLFGAPEQLYNREPSATDSFNERSRLQNSQVLDFLYLHYMTGRSDTEFWRQFSRENAPSGVKSLLNLLDSRILERADAASSSLWPIYSLFSIGLGVRNISFINSFNSFADKSSTLEQIEPLIQQMSETQDFILENTAYSHREFINFVKNFS